MWPTAPRAHPGPSTPPAVRPSTGNTIPDIFVHAAQDGVVRAYKGFSYIEYSLTNIIPFYYITEALSLRPYYFTIESKYRCHRYGTSYVWNIGRIWIQIVDYFR